MKENIRVLISAEAIEKRVREMAKELADKYKAINDNKDIVVVGILKGSVLFMAELVKNMDISVELEFMVVSSYGNDTVSSGKLKIKKDLDSDIDGKHILVVEDIVDTGRTLKNLVEYFKGKNAASVTVCTLLDKPDRREFDVDVDYTGFKIPDEFVVGYGLDYAQKYRNLPYIGVLSFEE